ncbi:MAG: 50S ribosomal protein L4 [Gemmatimonadota bacterium]
MAKARYYKVDGKKGRARSLPDSLFGGVVNESVLHTVVRAHLANRRQGTGSAKTRSEVRGGSRKPWRQKGTGRARQGSIRSVQWVGGGRAFPPQPHSWRQRIPKKVRALARQSAFTARAEEDRVVLIDALDLEAPATRRLVKYLESIEAAGKVLLLTDGLRDTVVLSARNVPEILVRPFGEESTYDILWATTVVIERSAIDALETGSPAETAKVAAEVESVPDVAKVEVAGPAEPDELPESGSDGDEEETTDA